MNSASSISVQKSLDHRSKSCDTVCTSNSSCFLQKRKQTNPLAYSVRSNLVRSTGNSVRQRVLSAKLLKLRSIQNQLNDANFHLSELSRENHTLKTLQKRQDKALSKYENTNADLPRLIHSHEEEIRILSEKNKTMRKHIKELNELLKTKEDELTTTREHLKHLEKLNKDKRLIDREKLMEQVEDLRDKLQKSDSQVTVLNRKLMLESKSAKQKLNIEIGKQRQRQRELNQALSEVERLTILLETKDTLTVTKKNRFSQIPTRQSTSLITLGGQTTCPAIPTSEKAINNDTEAPKSAVTEVKLEPIQCKQPEEKKQNGILKMPSENIRNRLSSGVKKKDTDDESPSKKTSIDSSESSSDSRQLSGKSLGLSRSNSSLKLAKIASTLEAAIKKASDAGDNIHKDFDTRLGDYCAQVVNNAKNCSDVLNSHKENLQLSKNNTDTLAEALKETNAMESKLKQSLLNRDDRNLDFVNEILNEEFKFQKGMGDGKKASSNGIAGKKEPVVRMEDKKKLLATLRAIDNGESFESVGDNQKAQTNMIKPLLGELYDK